MKFFAVIFITFIAFCGDLISQKGFTGSAIIGLNASQLDGDKLVGYDKLGLTTGVKVSFDLAKKLSGNVEILYSQRGSSESLFKRSDELDLTQLNYFELPFYISFADWYDATNEYFKMKGHIGFSYAAIVSTGGQTDLYDISSISNSDFSYLLGASYSFTPDWTFTARYTRALNKLLRDEALDVGYLLSYFWTFRVEYTF